MAVVYYWRRVTALPAAYTESAPGGTVVDATDASVLRLAREEIVQTVNEQIAQQPAQAEAEVVLDRQDVSNLVVSTIARQPQGEQWLQATQGVYTEVRDRAIEVGTVANLSDLPLDTLSASQQATLNRVLQTFPFLRDRRCIWV
ncbi:MAG: hypothetical protein HC925_03290 [Coleofasciculaceae cyanobacterium SM2_3_26]|nr:hypothetical protein [Coleofasciculaceae cyanobacterium SM2_3_26]